MALDHAALQRSVQDLLDRVDPVGLAGPRPLSEGLKAVIAAAEQILGVDCVGILLLDEDEQLRPVASSGSVAAALEQAQQELGEGPGVDTIHRASTVAVEDLLAVPAYHELADRVRRLGVRAVLSAPVWVNDSVAGNLNAVRLRPHEWRPDEITAAETYAEVIAALLQVSVSPGERA